MKKLLVTAAALMALSAAPAMAADMPVKVKPVKMYDWSGIYIGYHTGYLWGDVDQILTPTTAPFATNTEVEHWVWGFHGGAQWQFGAFGGWGLVLGVEAAFNLAGRHNGIGNYGACLNPAFTCGIWKVDDIGTAGVRLGIAADKWLFAISGGYAVGEIHRRAYEIATGVLDPTSRATVKTDGWYVGASLEYVVHKGTVVDVISGFDYQYIELDRARTATAGFLEFDLGPADISIIRARLTIKTKGWEIFYVPPPAAPKVSK
jgi:outer membrane immunogenic protein